MSIWTLRTAEFVWPGHPDKIADAIADRIVDETRRRDPNAHVTIEIALHRDRVFIDGRLAGLRADRVDVDAAVRHTYREIGHGELFCPAPELLQISTDLIIEDLHPGEADYRRGSDDQAIITGWATSLPGTEGLPVEHALARRIAIDLWHMKVSQPTLGLGPDGKILVTLSEGPDGRRWVVDDVTVSIQHTEDWDPIGGNRSIGGCIAQTLQVFATEVPGFEVPTRWTLAINPVGDFVLGGPYGDNGLTGKKLVADFYGPRVPIGGGAMSGKDFWKPDRSGPLVARELALRAVQRHGCQTCLVTLAIRPGDATFRILRIEAETRQLLDATHLASEIDLRVCGRTTWPDTHGPLAEVARWGHFASLPGFIGAAHAPSAGAIAA